MTSNEIRQQFLEFFKKKNHKIVQSAPVVPFNDPTLLFTNAGMNQFKDVFLGSGTRDFKRAADTQKCIRVSGKHNDLEEVGHDTYHHTFFEMLGNWSFGDYYKEEAIVWAWELLTDVWKLPKERLWVTVYRTDDESFELWKKKTDINDLHVLKFDEKDNFWEMGETGPCGPCSEIHINIGDDFNNPKYVNAGVPECIEIWNLVFIQNFRDEFGEIRDLPNKHVDTGMGFERIAAVLQNKKSNYDTDVFQPLIKSVAKLSGIPYEDENDSIAMRVIADHVRTLTFAIGDGATPGNDGRGYVLRRILRRASRYGRKLKLTEPFLFKLVDVVVQTMSDVFPELIENKANIVKIIKAEEESFNVTLDRGIELFEKVSEDVISNGKTQISGEEVFKLYDTFGFPVDLTNVMASEKGLSIDEVRFEELMNEQKERARQSTKNKVGAVNFALDEITQIDLNSLPDTLFTGYESLSTKTKIIATTEQSENTLVILAESPFYVESGGQVSDRGFLSVNGNQLELIDLKKVGAKIVHVVKGVNHSLTIGMEVAAEVDGEYRWDIMRNHSATHFLHSALREVLGKHVQQSGSYVGADRLRFDFSHFSKLTDEEIERVEDIINTKLRMNLELNHHKNIPFDKAKEMGAMMFFGDKYGDSVNVVQFGDYTLEFCGGTHVHNSSEIGLFKITSESSIASGVRRIEAVTGKGIQKYIEEQQNEINEANLKIELLNNEKRKLEKELSEQQLNQKLGELDSIINSPEDVGGILVYKGRVAAANMDELKSMGDKLRESINSGIGMLISPIEKKVGIVCVVSDDLIKSNNFSAGKIVGAVAKVVGGGGGGRPHLATAGGKDITKIDNALNDFNNIVAGF